MQRFICARLNRFNMGDVNLMRKYSSNLLLRLPLMIPAFFLLLFSMPMFYICFAEMTISALSFIQKLCIFIMAFFLSWVACVLVVTGLRDYYVEIIPDDAGIRYKTITKEFYLRWDEIVQVHESISTISLTTGLGKVLNISVDISGYEELRRVVKSKTEKKEDHSLPVSPEEITDAYHEQ